MTGVSGPTLGSTARCLLALVLLMRLTRACGYRASSAASPAGILLTVFLSEIHHRWDRTGLLHFATRKQAVDTLSALAASGVSVAAISLPA